MFLNRDQCSYAPFYCEENVWRLCRELDGADGAAVFIASVGPACFFRCHQTDPEGTLWDYHVVYLTDGLIFDLDSMLPFPTALSEYLQETFPADTPLALQPWFRLIPRHEYLQIFASDRSHMRAADGKYLQPPPPWPAIHPEHGNRVPELANMTIPTPGQVVDREGLTAMLEI